jgi:hypothetical protein
MGANASNQYPQMGVRERVQLCQAEPASCTGAWLLPNCCLSLCSGGQRTASSRDGSTMRSSCEGMIGDRQHPSAPPQFHVERQQPKSTLTIDAHERIARMHRSRGHLRFESVLMLQQLEELDDRDRRRRPMPQPHHCIEDLVALHQRLPGDRLPTHRLEVHGCRTQQPRSAAGF